MDKNIEMTMQDITVSLFMSLTLPCGGLNACVQTMPCHAANSWGGWLTAFQVFITLAGAFRSCPPPPPPDTKIAIALIGHSGSFSIYSNAADNASYMRCRRGRKTTLLVS